MTEETRFWVYVSMLHTYIWSKVNGYVTEATTTPELPRPECRGAFMYEEHDHGFKHRTIASSQARYQRTASRSLLGVF